MRRNVHARDRILSVIDDLTTTKFYTWAEKQPHWGSARSYAAMIFQRHGIFVNASESRYYPSPNNSDFTTNLAKDLWTLQRLALHLPKTRDALTRWEMDISREGLHYRGIFLMTRIDHQSQKFDIDNSCTGQGDKMPYSVTVYQPKDNVHPLFIDLCDDYVVKDDSNLTLYFLNEEDYLEALLAVNS